MSTMREEFEAWFSEDGAWPDAVRRSGDGYMLASAQAAWTAWQAAYAAGQMAATEQVAKVAEWYFGDPGEVNHSIAVAIRARDKEQGC